MSGSGSTLENRSLPRHGKKYFTLAEACRALALIKRIATDMQETQFERLRLHAELNSSLPAFSPQQGTLMQQDLDLLTTRLEQLIGELNTIGVELKDPGRALLDFPAIHEGREIYLCWQGGETTITHWHEIDAGFSGRRPVSELHDHETR